ncbi:hypothetical protein C8F01DRAFT_1361131 [Mycena amicta]|nr:hypothetical protein C8F01DRAFT_1361131 [Mycena amicta]
MPAKRPSLPPLLDLSSLVDIGQADSDIISDGRKRKRASAFTVDVVSDAFDTGRERCFLKIFPPDAANTLNFTTECRVNHVLNVHVAHTLLGDTQELSGKQSLEVFKSHLQLKSHPLPFPLCYGYLLVPDPFYQAPPKSRAKSQAKASPPMLNALLFQLYTDLRPCEPIDLDDAGIMQAKILRALEPLHAARVLHRDIEDRAAWPEARLSNIFVKADGNPVFLDFDHALVLGEKESLKRLEEEVIQLKDLLARALEGKGKERGWGFSKEAKKLLM